MGLIDALIPFVQSHPLGAGLSVLQTRVSPCSMLWTMYGPEAERFIANVISERAIDQKHLADRAAEEVLGRLFHPDTHPLFNVHLHLDQNFRFDNLRRDFSPAISIDQLEQIFQEKNPQYLHIEVDGALDLHLGPLKTPAASPTTPRSAQKTGGSSPTCDLEDYVLIEIKLFTSPLDFPLKSIQRHLQSATLERYFQHRHLFGLIGFSYLRRLEATDPIAVNDPVFRGDMKTSIPSIWAIHFFLCDQGFIAESPNAARRASVVFQNIDRHQQQIPHGLNPKAYKYALTYNIVKVLFMQSMIIELKNELEQERKAKEQVLKEKEQERKAKEQERKAKEQERKAKEHALKRAAQYRQKLLDLGVSLEEEDPNS
jgi:hypothetical protein